MEKPPQADPRVSMLGSAPNISLLGVAVDDVHAPAMLALMGGSRGVLNTGYRWGSRLETF